MKAGLHRRAVLIYLGTIVAPVCGLLWLGLLSFERQRQALASLTAEKLATELESRTQKAAEEALGSGIHPVALLVFAIERGEIVRPALHAPPPESAPAEFAEAERQELSLNLPGPALELYRQLAAQHPRKSLALARVARCLAKLGRANEARAVWHALAASYANDRDLSHRPYGIVAAFEAGETSALYDQIAAGRWDLAADQAEYFLQKLAPGRVGPYLERFRLAREVAERFRPERTIREGELLFSTIGQRRVFYRGESADRITGVVADNAWIAGALRPRIERELGMTGRARQDVWVYGGAIALALVILSFGLLLLLRDISRDAHINRLRSDLVSSVSHELKTPVTLIRLYGETLLGRPHLDAAQRADAHRVIVRESLRLSRLVGQVLTFSRIERGAEVYRLEEGDLAPVVAGVVDDYREYLEHAGFSIDRELAPAAPPVRFDPAAVSQAVINLLDNAMKYSGESRALAVRLAAHKGSVTFEVQDRGLGIPAVEQAHIFDRFYRAPNGSGKGGYGIGLFLVRHIMEAHGGRAEVESDAGQGSRFRLVFPVVAE